MFELVLGKYEANLGIGKGFKQVLTLKIALKPKDSHDDHNHHFYKPFNISQVNKHISIDGLNVVLEVIIMTSGPMWCCVLGLCVCVCV
jgi:hypothetical protein